MVVGGGTCIGANSFVSHSVIGRNCRIGRCAQFYDACLSVITLPFKERKKQDGKCILYRIENIFNNL